MARFLAILLVTILLTFPVERALAAERRVALVVGVGAYEAVPRLANATNDASAMADMFRKVGFDVVTLRTDVGNLAFKRAVREFEDAVTGADIAVVYYAGHGIEVGGQNYVVPSDAKLVNERDIEDEALVIDRLISVLEPAKSLRLLILDACRNNPFVNKMKRRVATRAVSAGLGAIEPSTSNTLIAYAAKGQAVANDGGGEHSPFTQALLNNIAIPGLDVRLALGRVRDEVLRATDGQQEPYVYGSLGGSTMALVSASPSTQLRELGERAREDFDLVKGLNSKAAYEAFLKSYKDGLYADLARVQLARLETTGAISKNDASPDILDGAKRSKPDVALPLPSVQPDPKPTAAEQKAWETLKSSTDLSAIRKFIKQYPSSPLIQTAQERADNLERLAREQDAARRVQEEAAHLRAEEEKRRKVAEAEQKRLEQEALYQRAEEERAKALEAKRQRAEEIAAAKQREAEERARAAEAAMARRREEEQAKAAAVEMRRKQVEEYTKMLEAQHQQAAREAVDRKRAQQEAAKAIEAARLAREAEELVRKREAAEFERQERARASEVAAREKEAAERVRADERSARLKDTEEQAKALAAVREKAVQEAAERKRETDAAAKAAADEKAAREIAEKARLRDAQEVERREQAKTAELEARDIAAQEQARVAELERQRAKKQELTRQREEERAQKLEEAGANSSQADMEAKRREADDAAHVAAEQKAERVKAAKQREAAEDKRRVVEEAAANRRKAAEVARQAAARQAEREKAAAEKRQRAAQQAKEATKVRAAQARSAPARVHAAAQPIATAKTSYGSADIGALRAFTRMP
ncbi:caspase family protein [Methylobacterium mesophilicum]